MRARQFWFLCTAFLTGVTGLAFINPRSSTVSVSALGAAFLIASIILIVVRSRSGNRWPFIALPLTLVASTGVVITLTSNATVRILMLSLVALSIGIYLDALLATRSKHATTNITDNRILYTLGHLALLTVFFTSSGMAALATYFNLPSALLVVVFTWMIYISGRGFTESVPHLTVGERWSIITLLTVAMVQVFIALVSLPFHFVIIGGLSAIVFYCVSGIARTVTLGLLNRSLIVRYVLGSIIAIAIVLAGAQWI